MVRYVIVIYALGMKVSDSLKALSVLLHQVVIELALGDNTVWASLHQELNRLTKYPTQRLPSVLDLISGVTELVLHHFLRLFLNKVPAVSYESPDAKDNLVWIDVWLRPGLQCSWSTQVCLIIC